MNDGKKIYEEKLKEYRDISKKIAELEIKRSSNLDSIKDLKEKREIVGKEIVRIKKAIDGIDAAILGKDGDEVKSLEFELDLLYKKREEFENYDGVSKAVKYAGEKHFDLMTLGAIATCLVLSEFVTSFYDIILIFVITMTTPLVFNIIIHDGISIEKRFKPLGKKINEFLKKRKIKKVSKKISICESKLFTATDRLNAVLQSNGDLYSERNGLLEEKKAMEDRTLLADDKIKILSDENLGIDNVMVKLLDEKERLFFELVSMEIDLMDADELDEIIVDEVQEVKKGTAVKKMK